MASEDFEQQSQIFLAHASEDKDTVLELYDLLKKKGYKPWLDVKDLMPGQNWRTEIPKAIDNSDFVILCLSQTSVRKQGYLQREFRLALNKYAEKTPETIFLIPLKLDDCQVPDLQLPELGVNLRDIQWLKYWEADGFDNLVRAIEHQLSESDRTSTKVIAPQPDFDGSGGDIKVKGSNPFGDKGRITNPQRFFDRQELLRQAFEELSRGVSLSLVGESQIGKSSILSQICDQAENRMQFKAEFQPKFVYLSLQSVDNEKDFYKALCDKLEIETCRGYKLTRTLRGKHYVLCLDEIEKMSWDGFTKNLRSQLRGLADGNDAPLTLAIASRSPLASLFPDSPELDSPLAGICRQLDVLPFDEEITRAFLLHRLQDTEIRFSEPEIIRLFVETKGHPARLQQLAADLYRLKQNRSNP